MKTIGRLVLSAIFLVLTGLMAAIAKFAPQIVFQFYPELSTKVLGVISGITSALPVAVWEVLALLILLWALYTFICVFSKHNSFFGWLSGIVLTFCVGLFLFTGLWGLNHFGPSVADRLELPVREYTKEELIAATRYYGQQASMLAPEVNRNADGCAEFVDFSELAGKAGEGYQQLAGRYPMFSGKTVPVKKLAAWPLYSRFGTTGIFVCFTGESCVNPDTYEAWIPLTMCHELAHQKGVAAEDGANFCGYLACMENDDPEFRYSGAFAAYIYCNNALFEKDQAAATEIWKSVDEGIRADANAANVHYEQYEGKVQDAAQKVNDVYLKAFSEESGVQSYGEVTDLLIAWYLQNS